MPAGIRYGTFALRGILIPNGLWIPSRSADWPPRPRAAMEPPVAASRSRHLSAAARLKLYALLF